MDEKAEFYKKLESYYSHKPGKKPYTLEEMRTMVRDLLNAKTNRNKKTRHEYYLLDKYDVLTIGDQQYLVCKNRKEDESKFIVPYEELYERISDYHTKTGHGGNVKLRTAITKHAVPRPAIEAFLATCVTCNFKKGTKQRNLVIEPVIGDNFNKRGEVSLINFQSTPDGEYKFILCYQDHDTKFLSLRPLKSKQVVELASNLLSIFLTFGAPEILESNIDREFINSVITELRQLWPDCVLVCGQCKPSKVLESTLDVQNVIKSWMTKYKSKKWSFGLQFVQYQKNCSHNLVIGKSPFKALFGSDPKTDLKMPNLPLEIILKEDDEENIHKKIKTEFDHPTNETSCDN